MINLKTYENFDPSKSLEDLCIKYIDNHNKSRINDGTLSYTIDGGYVNVIGQLSIDFYDLDEIPIRFGKVDGSMFLRGDIITLKNSPKEVSHAFNIMGCNKLTSLEGGPEVF
jgi:hypothetical protein